MSDHNNPFQILGTDKVPTPGGQEIQEENKSEDINERIKNLIESSELFLFMKGNPEMPQCGFSANVVTILNHLQKNYKTFNVLSDWDVREGVKVYSNWPTFPQLYYKGKLVGGNDIITEMFETGELEKVLNS